MRSRVARYIWYCCLCFACALAAFAQPGVAPTVLDEERNVPKLIQYLRDPSSTVRGKAALRLGELRNPEAVLPLIAALDDADPAVRTNAVGALKAFKDPRAIDPLIGRLSDSDAVVRAAVTSSLECYQDPRVIEALIGVLGDATSDIRHLAAHSLGVIRHPRAVPALSMALRDPATEIRKAAAQALWAIRAPQSADALLHAATEDADAGVRETALVALGALGDARAVEPALALLADPDPDKRVTAVRTIGTISDPRVVPALCKALTDPNKTTRFMAINALDKLADPHAVDALLAACDDPDASFSGTAKQALAKIGPPAFDALMAALRQTENPARRRNAAAALREFRQKPEAVEALIAVLGDPDFALRSAALSSLRYTVDPRLVEPALACLQERDTAVRLAALVVLKYNRAPQAQGALIPLLRDANQDVVAAVLDTLLWTGGTTEQNAIDPLLTLARTGKPQLRGQAMRLLVQFHDPRVKDIATAALADRDPALRIAAIEHIKLAWGIEGIDPLIAILKHETIGEVRQQAVSALAAIDDARCVEPLIAALHDPHEGTATWALQCIGRLGDTRAIPPLVQIIQHETSRGTLAADALVNIGEASVIQEMLPVLKSPDDRRRLNASCVLVAFGDARGVDPLLELLKHRDPDIRRDTLRAIDGAQRHDPRFNEQFIHLLSEASPDEKHYGETCLITIGYLARVGEQQAFEPLLRLLARPDSDEQIRELVAEALGKLKDRRAVDPLLTLLTTPSPQLRRMVVQALGAIGDPRIAKPLAQLAQQDEDIHVRKEAAVSLYRLGDPRCWDFPVTGLKDASPKVRLLAIRALQEINAPPAAEMLAKSLGDQDPLTRMFAAYALVLHGDARGVLPLLDAYRQGIRGEPSDLAPLLGKFHDTKTVDAVLAMLADPDSENRLLALFVLEELRDSRAVAPLLAAYPHETETRLREKTLEVLGSIGDAQAETLLLEALHDRASRLRERAAKSLGLIRDQRAIGLLIAALKGEKSTRVRRECATALRLITGHTLGDRAEDWMRWQQGR